MILLGLEPVLQALQRHRSARCDARALPLDPLLEAEPRGRAAHGRLKFAAADERAGRRVALRAGDDYGPLAKRAADPAGRGPGGSTQRQRSGSAISAPVQRHSTCAGANHETRRQLRQSTRLQNPNKDRIVSGLSQDKVSVCDQTDSGRVRVKPEIRVKHPRKEVKIAAVPDVYSPRVRGPREYIPPRALAHDPRGEHGDMNKGCYYMMAAMDFCWCL